MHKISIKSKFYFYPQVATLSPIKKYAHLHRLTNRMTTVIELKIPIADYP